MRIFSCTFVLLHPQKDPNWVLVLTDRPIQSLSLFAMSFVPPMNLPFNSSSLPCLPAHCRTPYRRRHGCTSDLHFLVFFRLIIIILADPSYNQMNFSLYTQHFAPALKFQEMSPHFATTLIVVLFIHGTGAVRHNDRPASRRCGRDTARLVQSCT